MGQTKIGDGEEPFVYKQKLYNCLKKIPLDILPFILAKALLSAMLDVDNLDVSFSFFPY